MCIEFIVQHGENYKVFGAWKVYTNVEQALTTFDSYRACTQYLTYIYQQGCSSGDNLSRQPDRAYKTRPHCRTTERKHI